MTDGDAEELSATDAIELGELDRLTYEPEDHLDDGADLDAGELGEGPS